MTKSGAFKYSTILMLLPLHGVRFLTSSLKNQGFFKVLINNALADFCHLNLGDATSLPPSPTA